MGDRATLAPLSTPIRRQAVVHASVAATQRQSAHSAMNSPRRARKPTLTEIKVSGNACVST